MNINAGYNQELKDACASLKEYCLFVERVRQYAAGKAASLEEAVNRAVEECIAEGILKEFLIAHRGEVVTMSILEFTLEDWIKVMQAEKEEGLAESMEKGRTEGKRIGEETGLKALVTSLAPLLPDFEAVYKAVIANEEYKDYTKDQVAKYYPNRSK